MLYSTVVEEEKDTEEPKDAERGGRMETPPPLFVYADFEAMQNVEGIFVANLMCPSAKEAVSYTHLTLPTSDLV